jgi:hypothetical protein
VIKNKTMKPILLVLLSSFILLSCNNSNNFEIKIEHKLKSNPPSSVKYTITEKELKVELNQRKLPFGKKETSYSKTLNSNQISDILSFIESQKMDTLKSNYKVDVGENYLSSTIQINRNGKKTIYSLLENTSVPAADNLYNYIDNLIDNSSFKLGKHNN